MAHLIESLKIAGSRKSDGTPNAGGKVYAYYPGSGGVQAPIYSDWQSAAALAQPVTLDAGGRAEIWIEAAVELVIQTSTGAAVGTISALQAAADSVEVINAGYTGVDPDDGTSEAGNRTNLDAVLTSLATSAGGVDGLVKATGGTASRTIAAEVRDVGYNVKQFGARGDGITDDTAAFSAALSAADADGGIVLVPPGAYVASSFLNVGAGVTVRGVGIGNSFSSNERPLISLTNNLVNLFSCIGGGTIERLSFLGAGTVGVAISGGSRTVVDRCYFGSGFATGVSGTGELHNCTFAGPAAAITGTWLLRNTTVNSGTVASTTTYAAATASSSLLLYAAATTDMANGGNTTPTLGSTGQPVAHHRIRGTSAGSGTVNATATPTHSKVLYLDLFNNSGGAFTFTMNAQYHVSANPAPGNGQRILLTLVWDETGGFWVQAGAQTVVT